MHAATVLLEASSNLLGPLIDGGSLLASDACNVTGIVVGAHRLGSRARWQNSKTYGWGHS